MDLIAYWNVVKRQRRIVVVGLGAAAALALVSLVKPTSGGVTWRTPPIYDSTTTLMVAQEGAPWGRSTVTEYQTSEYLASLYARIATSDVIKRGVGARLGIEEPEYDAAPLAGVEGRELPLFQIRAFETSPDGAVDLATAVARSVRNYHARQQASNRIPGEDRVELRVLEAATEAEVFQGVRMTGPVMLFLLASMVALAVAFVVDNLRGGRPSAPAQTSGEPEAALGIVRNEPEAEEVDDEEEERLEEPVARSRWAAPS